MKLFSLVFFIFNFVLIAGEVSVFDAGNLESKNPYGLTSSEKVILKNKNELNKFDRKIDDTRSNLDVLNERIDGIESIIDGDSRKLNSTTIELSKLVKKNQLEQESDQIHFDHIKETQTTNINKINLLKEKINYLEEELLVVKESFNSLLKQVDKDYVTKKQFEELVVFINKEANNRIAQEKAQSKAQAKSKKTNFTKSNKKLLKEAKVLFTKDYFTKAIPILEHLISKNYRPAESNFYLGEIWFHRKKYKDAIHHFKTSMMLYDKAKYIPKLLLHSAISFEKVNDLDNAANFYGTLIDVYPQTEEAKEAQKKLEKIK